MTFESKGVDLYQLIVDTSQAINTLIIREKTRKFPKCIQQIQEDLIGKTIAADVVPVMREYIGRVKHSGH